MGLTRDEARKVVERAQRLCDAVAGGEVDPHSTPFIIVAHELRADLERLQGYLAGIEQGANGAGNRWEARYRALLAQYERMVAQLEEITKPEEDEDADRVPA